MSWLGLVTDLGVLHLGTQVLHVQPAWARAASIFCAMQVTFLVNAIVVFRILDRRRAHLQWCGYMAANGVGNVCNYLCFTTLLSLHRPVLSDHIFAVCAGGALAWAVNYSCARLIVFSDGERPGGARLAVWRARLASIRGLASARRSSTGVGCAEP